MNHQNGLVNAHGCNEWNTCYEEKITKSVGANSHARSGKNAKPTKLNDVKGQDIKRSSSGFEEIDRVLGGGIVKGSLILLGGEPGIRKVYINFTALW